LELGKYGITVNAYAPGPILTPMLQYTDELHAQRTHGKAGDFTETVGGLKVFRSRVDIAISSSFVKGRPLG
ncbi:hypothetical protein H0H93_001920, partial [Arthromyces matolae]